MCGVAAELPGGHSEREPPDPISNSEVKPFSADDSVGFLHAKVGHRQASYPKNPTADAVGFFLAARNCLSIHPSEIVSHVASRLRTVEQETTQLRAHLHKRKIQAMSDPLTGIPNRMAFEDRLTREYGRWKRYCHPLTLMILDVDQFKRINDGYGHKVGDKALQLIALVLRKHLRVADFLTRYGGEEFVVLLPEMPPECIEHVAEKLRQVIEVCEFHYRGQRVTITVSCGYAGFRDVDTTDEVFRRADTALYRAKAAGYKPSL